MKFAERFSSKSLVYFFVALSLIIGWRLNYIQHGWVNNDFVLYHEAARLFYIGEWKEATGVYSWPLYSLLIACLHKLIGFNLQICAQILTVLFFGLTTYSFLTIIRISNGNKTVITFGALVLFSSSYFVGRVMPMLLRDPGAWAFFLLGMVFFIRFYRSSSWLDALFWQLCAIVATLFRVEYITYLVLMPFVVLLNCNFLLKQRVKQFVMGQFFTIATFLILLILLTFVSSLTIEDFGRLKEVTGLFGEKYKSTVETFLQKLVVMDKQVLNGDFGEYAAFGLIVAFLSMCVVKCMSAIGWLNTGVLFYTRKKLLLISPEVKKILFFSVFLSLINIAVILMSVFLVAGRYIAPLVFAFFIIISFSLASLLDEYRRSNSLRVGALIYIVVFLMFFGVLKNLWVKPEGSNFQQAAVAWLKAHEVDNRKVFFDHSRVRYFAGAEFQGAVPNNRVYLIDAIKSHRIKDYEYLVINQSPKHPEIEAMVAVELPQFREIKRFYGVGNRKSIAIYKKDN